MKGRRPKAHDGPKCGKRLGVAPAWLPPDAKLEWKRVVKLLKDMGADASALHQAAMINYCVAMDTVKKATREIERDGLTITNDIGIPVKHPASTAQTQALTQARNYMVELGLTPGSSGKIPMRKEAAKNRFEGL